MTAIEITGIRVRAALVTVRRPVKSRAGAFTQAPFLLIDLDTKGGITGRVLACTYSRLGLKLLPPVLEDLAGFAQGSAIAVGDIPVLHDACLKRHMFLGHEGVTQMALSMFDLAVYDALARAAGVPLYRLIGGSADPIPAYNSCGAWLVEPAEAARDAKELAAECGGYRHIKMRLGRESLADDIAAIKAVREAVGPDAMVSADFNQGLTASTALEVCRAIDNLGLTWIEEPVVYDDYETHARLTSKLATPIQTGEDWWSWRVGKAAIEARACDYIMPDILRIGGITGWLRLARFAAVASMPYSSHLSPEFSAHALAATPTRHWLEYMDWGQDLITDPIVPEKGFVKPKETPGVGLEWNEQAVARCLIGA
ncbi:MAG: enolase C-terminal domain-like protein [Hyphomicrobiaceae bacterium]